MAPRGRSRKHNPRIPAHIDQSGLPKGVYWDPSGNGRWYTFVVKEGRPARETIAGPTVRNSDLHRIVERARAGTTHGTVSWMMEQFNESSRFKELASGTQTNYKADKKVVDTFPTSIGITFGQLMAARVTQTNIQRMHEKIVKQGHPSKANRVLRYLRRVYKWAGPHLGMQGNPAKGIEQARERAQKKVPIGDAYQLVTRFAHERGQRKPHTQGSCPPYLAPLMELALLCRLRGIEALTLTDAAATEVGIVSNRRKGSFDNTTRWTPRLRASWEAALKVRREILAKPGAKARPIPLRAEDRRVFLNESGTPLTKSGLDSAWQRLMQAATHPEDGVISKEQYFTLHGLKHRGITDTKGNKATKRDAAGHVDPKMTDRYDDELQTVEPAQTRGFYGEFYGEADSDGSSST